MPAIAMYTKKVKGNIAAAAAATTTTTTTLTTFRCRKIPDYIRFGVMNGNPIFMRFSKFAHLISWCV